jgi:hypothetical protein
MNLALETYLDARNAWPERGRHILAQHDADTVVVYQAYRPGIAAWAVEHQKFGGRWSFDRMSWIKPNYLWMMYRSGWATKPNQERVLAVWLSRDGFDAILSEAVETSYRPETHDDHSSWKSALSASDVRLQWDPDHDPTGKPVQRRAMQLGMKGTILKRYATDWIVAIEDITPFVDEQRKHSAPEQWSDLRVPRERVVKVEGELGRRLRLT